MANVNVKEIGSRSRLLSIARETAMGSRSEKNESSFTDFEKELRKRSTSNGVKLLMPRTEGRFEEKDLQTIFDKAIALQVGVEGLEDMQVYFPEFSALTEAEQVAAIKNYAKNKLLWDICSCNAFATGNGEATAMDAINVIKLRPADQAPEDLPAQDDTLVPYDATGKTLRQVIADSDGELKKVKNRLKRTYKDGSDLMQIILTTTYGEDDLITFLRTVRRMSLKEAYDKYVGKEEKDPIEMRKVLDKYLEPFESSYLNVVIAYRFFDVSNLSELVALLYTAEK